MNVEEFYAESHFRDPFGQKRPGTNDHRGLDIAGWDEGTPVPAWVGGTVVTSEYQSGLGWVVVVDSPVGFAGVSHLRSRGAAAGTFVPFGGTWGPLGNTGSLSKGKHAHMTLSRTSRFPWTGAVIDPTPHIRAARTASTTAGGGSRPLETESEFDMSAFILSSSGGQNLVIDEELFYFDGPDDVRAMSGAPVVGVSAAMHGRILQRYTQKNGDALPVIVSVPEGNGTIYAMSGGKLTPLVDPNTVRQFQDKGAIVITLSLAEAKNLLAQQ